MNFRRSVSLVGSILLLAIVGLVIIAGLAIGLGLIRPGERPAHLPVTTPRRSSAAPVAYTVLAPTSAPLPNSTSTLSQISLLPTDESPPSPAGDTPLVSSVPAEGVVPSPTPTPDPSDAQAGAPPTTSAPGTSLPSPTPTLSSSSAGTPTPTLALTGTPGPTPTPTSPTSPTNTPSVPGRIIGRVLLDGAPVSGGVTLKLEDQAYNLIAETTVGADGTYVFPDLQPSAEGYNVLFAQEWNTQYEIDQVISWGWIGPAAVENGADVQLPDLDISLLGFGQVKPAPNATFSAAALSSQNPILFEWTTYPQAATYWVDLARGEEEEQEVVWQSPLNQASSLAFDGTLGNGSRIQSGDYWWGVGARRDSGSYPLTVYGYLSVLRIEP
jgi:hypothetical protein